MTRILFKFIIYPFVKGPWRTGGRNQKKVRISSFGDMIFLTSHNYLWLFFICFLYYAKKGIVVEISKVREPLEKSLPLCKGSRKCKKIKVRK